LVIWSFGHLVIYLAIWSFISPSGHLSRHLAINPVIGSFIPSCSPSIVDGFAQISARESDHAAS
jgi:hypothetical protein